MINTIEKYKGQTMQLGRLDCLSMLLEVMGRDDLLGQVQGRYKTILGARRTLPKATGYSSLHNLLENYDVITNSYFIQDGDIIIADNLHCYIYISGMLFGVWDDGIFGFKQVDLPLDITNSTIYRF